MNVKRIEMQSTSPPSGNLVDGLPLVCSTRAVVYETRWAPRKMVHRHPKMVEVSMFCMMTLRKSHRIRCGTYYEDSVEANQITKSLRKTQVL